MMIQQVGFSPKEAVNMEHRACVSFLIDKVDTMQKSRLQGPSAFHSVLKGPRFISNTLRPRSEPRKAVPSLNVPTCAFFENMIPGELKLKTLNMEHFVQRQSGDSFCDQLRYPIFQEKLIHSKRINFNRALLLKNCLFWVSERGTPFEPQFCAQKWRSHNLGEEPGKPKPLFQQGRPCVKSYCFVLIKGKSPSGISIHPEDFGRIAIYHGEFGDKGRLTWNILHLILFYPTKRREVGNPKLKEPNFPIDLFSIKLLLSNASRLKSSKMSPTAATCVKNDDSGSGVQPKRSG